MKISCFRKSGEIITAPILMAHEFNASSSGVIPGIFNEYLTEVKPCFQVIL
jgi:hypothetical protein